MASGPAVQQEARPAKDHPGRRAYGWWSRLARPVPEARLAVRPAPAERLVERPGKWLPRSDQQPPQSPNSLGDQAGVQAEDAAGPAYQTAVRQERLDPHGQSTRSSHWVRLAPAACWA